MKFMSPERRMLRSMGFISDQQGIITRYMQEREGWDLHLQHTRKFITDLQFDGEGSTVAVLGSGWLLDLPLDELAGNFSQVILVDIYHPPQVREKVAHRPNVSLFECDLSGGAIRFAWEIVRRHKKLTLDELQLIPPAILPEVDFFISLNILNQLDIIPADYLQKKLQLKDEDLLPFRQKVQQFHIDWITGKAGCLISDIEEINTGADGLEISRMLLHASLPGAIRSENWDWQFDSRASYRKGMQTRMKVKALEWSAIKRI